MKRIPEPELMLDPEQVAAYAKADFEEPNSNFIYLFKEKFPDYTPEGLVLDLGCGPGDISFRFVSAFPDTLIHAVDGSLEMINYGTNLLSERLDIKNKIIFIHSTVQCYAPVDKYDYIISNSILHHLGDPMVLWESIKTFSKIGSRVFVMDLLRPESIEDAMSLTSKYTKDEPDILKRDFYNSLLAAFKINEVIDQMVKAGIDLKVEQVSDRHLIVYG